MNPAKYKKMHLTNINELVKYASGCNELKYILNNKWYKRVKAVVESWDEQLIVSDGAYELYRILSEDITPNILEQKLCIVSNAARKQNKLRSYRKTRNELQSKQTNQILGSIFEIFILSAIIEAHSSVQLFPSAKSGNKEVEAKLQISNRWVYFEVKAIGYSLYDRKQCIGAHSIDSMEKQITDALLEKLDSKKQLASLADMYPTVLMLAMGHNADWSSCSRTIENFLSNGRSNVSYIIIFGSAFCYVKYKSFINTNSSYQLTNSEKQFFETDFLQCLFHHLTG